MWVPRGLSTENAETNIWCSSGLLWNPMWRIPSVIPVTSASSVWSGRIIQAHLSLRLISSYCLYEMLPVLVVNAPPHTVVFAKEVSSKLIRAATSSASKLRHSTFLVPTIQMTMKARAANRLIITGIYRNGTKISKGDNRSSSQMWVEPTRLNVFILIQFIGTHWYRIHFISGIMVIEWT